MSGDDLKKYLECEINAIVNHLGDSNMKDKNKINECAIEWIEQHAEEFRKNWNNSQGSNELK
jgi:hypothetical protein